MSNQIEFLGGTTSSLRQEYLERLKYKKYVEFDGMIDIWYDNYDYGFLNSNYEPMTLLDEEIIQKNFLGYADGVSALNFVSDAFSDFRDSYIEKTNNSTIEYPPYMEGLIPKAGYSSFEDIYANWGTYCAVKYSSFLQNDLSIVDYRSFLAAIKKQFVSLLQRFPITKSGFCLSSRNDIKTTGLAIELTDLDYEIDTYKGEIVQSLEFRCFVEEANKFGFLVDKYVPWRLLANLEHPIMRLYIRGLETDPGEHSFANHFKKEMNKDKRHKDFTTREIMDNIYRSKTHFDDIFHVQDFVIKIYNQIVLNVPYYTKMEYRSHDNSYQKINIFRTGVDFLKTEEWLDLLIMIRLLELGKYTESEHERIFRKTSNILKLYNFRAALSCIGVEMAKFIKEDFTNMQKSDIIDPEDIPTRQKERKNKSEIETRIITNVPTPPSSGGSGYGY